MSHSHPKQPDIEDSPMGYHERLALALRELMIEKDLVTTDEIRRQIELIDSRSPVLGARVVARAGWTWNIANGCSPTDPPRSANWAPPCTTARG